MAQNNTSFLDVSAPLSLTCRHCSALQAVHRRLQQWTDTQIWESLPTRPLSLPLTQSLTLSSLSLSGGTVSCVHSATAAEPLSPPANLVFTSELYSLAQQPAAHTAS